MADTQDSRDLLQNSTCCRRGNGFPTKPNPEDRRSKNVDLNLGLSLNGRFGLKPENMVANNIKKNNLFRASSVTDFVNFSVDVELSLSKTCSLSPETSVDWRKRKELLSVRRSEAKRKRVEKLKQLPPSPLPPLMAMQFSSSESIVPQGSGGFTGVSDLDSQPFSDKIRYQKNEGSESIKFQWKVKTKPKVHCAMDPSMPCVSTKGDGPDSIRIQGFLNRYGKGEEVRLVCVCHGNFLTPAEFVKHGGGGDVEHPLRHIVVTSPLFS